MEAPFLPPVSAGLFGVSFLLCAKLYRLRVESTTPKEKGRGAAAFLQLDGFREVHARGCGGRMP
jgi:hypothetical protein